MSFSRIALRSIRTAVKQPNLPALMLASILSGCATSGDMAYKYQDNAETCVKLGREIARQTGDSKYRRSLNQRYYQNCVGK